jgi:DNA-binding winged helix-turn-helix (wHTH) protein
VMVHVRRLREKVEVDPSDPQLVLTVRGLGYRFAADDDQPDAAPADDAPVSDREPAG